MNKGYGLIISEMDTIRNGRPTLRTGFISEVCSLVTSNKARGLDSRGSTYATIEFSYAIHRKYLRRIPRGSLL